MGTWAIPIHQTHPGFPRAIFRRKWFPCLISMIYKIILIEMSLIMKTIYSFFCMSFFLLW